MLEKIRQLFLEPRYVGRHRAELMPVRSTRHYGHHRVARALAGARA